MADELISYYERYKDTFGDEAYSMGKVGETSRVLTLMGWVQAYIPKGGKILDVGCGDMRLSELLPDYEWVGIDVAPNMSNGKAIKHDLMTTPYPFEAASFHGAICSEVLEHLWDLRVVNKEVSRLLKKGGYYLVSTPNFDWIDHHLQGFRQLLFDPQHKHLFEHIRQYNYEVHERFLKEAGFEVIDYTGADAHYSHFFLEARGRLKVLMEHQFGIHVSDGGIDQILGGLFPKCNHTIMLAARKT